MKEAKYLGVWKKACFFNIHVHVLRSDQVALLFEAKLSIFFFFIIEDLMNLLSSLRLGR